MTVSHNPERVTVYVAVRCGATAFPRGLECPCPMDDWAPVEYVPRSTAEELSRIDVGSDTAFAEQARQARAREAAKRAAA